MSGNMLNSDLCSEEIRSKCDSFYKQAFLNRNELIKILENKIKELQLTINNIENYCNSIKKNYLKSDMCEYCDGKEAVSNEILKILGDSNE